MNKSILTVLLSNTVLFCEASSEKIYTLNEAIKVNMIEYALTGSSNSTHYQKPVELSIKNKTNQILKIKIETGSLLEANDASLQNLITVKNEMIAIAPFGQKQTTLNAMCVQKNDAAPVDGKKYVPLEMATGALLELTKLIEMKNYFDIAAQQAIWCLTDASPIEDISGWNSEEVTDLQKFVSKATGKPLPPPPAKDDTKRNYQNTSFEQSIEGSFTYTVRQQGEVLIAMFDKDNRVVRELYRNNTEQPGKKDFAFAFDSTVYTDKVYHIRLLINGEKRIEGKVVNE